MEKLLATFSKKLLQKTVRQSDTAVYFMFGHDLTSN